MASLLLRLGRYDEAIQACDSLLALEARSAPAYAMRGQCYLELGNIAAAEHDFERATTLDPHFGPRIQSVRERIASRPASAP